MTTCDNHSIYKTRVKEIAAQDGATITFIVKPNTWEGNSCQIHHPRPTTVTAMTAAVVHSAEIFHLITQMIPSWSAEWEI